MTGKRNYWAIGGGLAILIVVAPELWGEFREPGETAWNSALAVMLVALVVASVLGQWYFTKHSDEIGEARFDTRNKDGE